MERSGIYFNTEKALEHAKKLSEDIDSILCNIYLLVGNSNVNLSSNDDVSAILYGGVITEDIYVPVGHYKTGNRKGEVKFKKKTLSHYYNRLVDPLPRTETAKSKKRIEDGTHSEHSLWEVNEPVLRSLKAKGKGKEIIKLLLEYNKLEKLRGTYLEGYAKLIEKMNWEHNMLYPSYNQCVAITGRLSSSKPNGQNADKQTKKYMETRYG
jgi:DNA polymerase I-like protein with 3'-5' exonuclease and polymerase domains